MNDFENVENGLKELFNSSVAHRNLVLYTMAQKFPIEFLQVVSDAKAFEAVQSRLQEIIVPPKPPEQLYKVVLTDMGRNKTQCIKLVREITGCGLVDATGIVEATAGHKRTIKRGLTHHQAHELCARFQEAGSNACPRFNDNTPDLDLKDSNGYDIPSF